MLLVIIILIFCESDAWCEWAKENRNTFIRMKNEISLVRWSDLFQVEYEIFRQK